jgi:hypothetical protein
MQRKLTLSQSHPSLGVRREPEHVFKALPKTPTPDDAPSTPVMASSSSANPSSQQVHSLTAAIETQRALLTKRLQTWAYLKRVHQGSAVLWFNTVCLSRADLEAGLAQDLAALQARATRFMVLGLNLSAVLDIATPGDFLKSLAGLAGEFDQLSDEQVGRAGSSRVRFASCCRGTPERRAQIIQRGLLKSRTLRSKSGGPGSLASVEGLYAEDPSSSLLWPNIVSPQDVWLCLPRANDLCSGRQPFDLDYFETLFTLCDMLTEVYTRMLSFLQPSLLSSSASSLHGSANHVSPGVVELSGKVDGKLKVRLCVRADVMGAEWGGVQKISTLLCKEVDGVARQSMRAELEGLSGADFGLDLLGEAY